MARHGTVLLGDGHVGHLVFELGDYLPDRFHYSNLDRCSMIKQLSKKTMKEMKKAGEALRAAGRKGAPKPKGRAVAEQPVPVVKDITPKAKHVATPVNQVEVEVVPEMSAERAMELIGWEIVEDGPFHLKHPVSGEKVRLVNNSTNRPFRLGLANRYKSEFLRGKWKLNGETIIVDWDGKIQSGQHRLAGFIMAEAERLADKRVPGKEGVGWKEWCKALHGHGGPLTMPAIIVTGIDPSPETVNTIDQGLKRTVGDVFYREERFATGLLPQQPAPAYSEKSSSHGTEAGRRDSVGKVSKPAPGVTKKKGKQAAAASDQSGADDSRRVSTPMMNDAIRRKLCNILANATRLVWLRSGGKKVSDAPHFPLSEAEDFINENLRLEDCVLLVWGYEGGSGKGGQKISRYVSLGYAAGLMYLMMTSGTDPDEWRENGAAALNFDMEPKAKEFWSKLASGAGLKENDPILQVRQMLLQVDAGSGTGRDEVVGMIIKAFNLWADGQEAEPKDVAMKKSTKDNGRQILIEEPRLGGIDVEGPDEPEYIDPLKVDDTREATVAEKGKWGEGDTCWVRAEDGEHWFGTIVEVIKTVDGIVAMIEDNDTGRRWEEPIKNLWLKYPG
jgi:hypothetical protein